MALSSVGCPISQTPCGLDSWSKDGAIEGQRFDNITVTDKEIVNESEGITVLKGYYQCLVPVKRISRAHHDVNHEVVKKLKKFRHPNIVRVNRAKSDQEFEYLAPEIENYESTCSLYDLIRALSDPSKDSVFPPHYKNKMDSLRDRMQDVELWTEDDHPSTSLLELIRNMVSGLICLHGKGIIHGDLKPQNVLITKNENGSLVAQLSDIGISKRLPEDTSSSGDHATGCGSPGWRAPEQFLHGGHQTCAMDLFSLGCVLFFCVTHGKHPFGEPSKRDNNMKKNIMDPSSVKIIPEAMDMFSRLLKLDPKLRLKASEVLHHPIFWNSNRRLSFLRDFSDHRFLPEKIKRNWNANGELRVLKKKEREAEVVKEKARGSRKANGSRQKEKWEAEVVEGKADGSSQEEVREAEVVEEEWEAEVTNWEAKVLNALLKALESEAPEVFEGNWATKIDGEVMKHLRHYRVYDGSLLRYLVRAVRNSFSHQGDAPENVLEILGRDDEDLDAYFAERLSKLLIVSYGVAFELCKRKKTFQKYF
ncbi:serine/threonine-protein kinase/endoribonuclease IRE1a-like [Syzygium oleosum]|uniref:serine/threonine-protein kinase/endoribonuclease IRE1a-like n=1 Tax=Syzygium oleosum TaxID=219896 RepID=UPI0024BB625F|nr:serine/threonine-protein kinase/endoribonuclease IRE1a-like [Syzygium oleosum]